MLNKLLKIAGKDGFVLDQRIGKSYLMRILFKYGLMMIRGRYARLFSKGISKSVFIGKKVKFIKKSYLYVGSKTKIHDGVKIDALSTDGVRIGENVVLGHDTVIECTGSLTSIGKGVSIGNGTTFGNNCYFGAAGGIDIGDNVVAGQFIRFHSENHKYNDLDVLIKDQGVTHRGIQVGNNCWIGAGVVFLDGAVLGDGCVVAANAVVRGKIRENSVVGGIPAKIIKERGDNT